MLDQPGEWYLDRQTGTLSYWPREGEDLTRAEVIAPVVQKSLLVVAGTTDAAGEESAFQGYSRSSRGLAAAALWICGDVRVPGASGTEGPEASKKYRWIDAAVSFKYARGCDFLDGGIRHAGGIGLSLLNGCAENTIEGNEIYDLGGGGITAGGIRNRDTWKWADPIGPDEHKGYRIANNHIHDCGLDYFGAIGIFLGLTQDALVAHNLIHDVAYAGIVLSGNEAPGPPFARNNTVEYNHIHDVMKVAVDGAGIYVSFPQADRGAAIRGNWIHDLRRNPDNPRDAGPWSAAGIYLDGVRADLGCRGYQFEKNVVYGTESPLFFCQCSREWQYLARQSVPEGRPTEGKRWRPSPTRPGWSRRTGRSWPTVPYNRARGSVELAHDFLFRVQPLRCGRLRRRPGNGIAYARAKTTKETYLAFAGSRS